MSDLPRFSVGDELRIRGHRYRVTSIDPRASVNRVLQYRLEPLEGAPPALLKPQHDEGEFAYQPVHGVAPSDIEEAGEG